MSKRTSTNVIVVGKSLIYLYTMHASDREEIANYLVYFQKGEIVCKIDKRYVENEMGMIMGAFPIFWSKKLWVLIHKITVHNRTELSLSGT